MLDKIAVIIFTLLVQAHVLSVQTTPKIVYKPTPTPKEFAYPTPWPTDRPTTIGIKQESHTANSVVAATIGESELIGAINSYRIAHGINALITNDSLCMETRKRVQDMISLNAGRTTFILTHDGMEADIQSGRMHELVGKSSYGENIASAYCRRPSDGADVDITTGTQLVEWCFDSSPGHRANLLNPSWTDVCSSGQFPFYVETFAK